MTYLPAARERKVKCWPGRKLTRIAYQGAALCATLICRLPRASQQTYFTPCSDVTSRVIDRLWYWAVVAPVSCLCWNVLGKCQVCVRDVLGECRADLGCVLDQCWFVMYGCRIGPGFALYGTSALREFHDSYQGCFILAVLYTAGQGRVCYTAASGVLASGACRSLHSRDAPTSLPRAEP